jgi:hypothetical protein
VAATLASPVLLPIALLVGSNLFMTFAWYGHLRFKQVPLAGVIVASWVIAFAEYCMAVPTNRRDVTPDLRLVWRATGSNQPRRNRQSEVTKPRRMPPYHRPG